MELASESVIPHIYKGFVEALIMTNIYYRQDQDKQVRLDQICAIYVQQRLILPIVKIVYYLTQLLFHCVHKNFNPWKGS